MARLRARIRGLVQGVFYRASAVKEASRLGLTGWVANQPDGSVLLEAQGDEAKLEELMAWCERGPPSARVTEVEREDLAEVVGERTFGVRR